MRASKSQNRLTGFRSVAATLWGILCLAGAVIGQESSGRISIDFDRQIRPLLSDRCFQCHGPDAGARKARLRLDTHEGMRTDRGGYAAVVAGQPGKSEMISRLRADDPDDRMPPVESKLSVSPEEIALLEEWIRQGARFDRHWAFTPPTHPTPPTATNQSWPRNGIDRFILARFEAEELGPSPRADRRTLARRAAFTLTGLAPDIEDLDAFLADTDPDAWEQWVDLLLSNRHYGERMASDWMDVARYADSYGYQSDVHRDLWPWRNWLIDSFNSNLPYDQFVTWQLAGDLMDNPTPDQKLATTFNRLHRQTNEGGSVEEEFRAEYVAERTQTFGMAFMGLTLECARCHDHKFDPILQREFYELSSFFANIDESGLYSHFTAAVPSPALSLATAKQGEDIQALKQEIVHRETKIKTDLPRRRAAFNKWLRARPKPETPAIADVIAHYPLDAMEKRRLQNTVNPASLGSILDDPVIVPGKIGGAVKLSGDNNVHFPGIGGFTRADAFSISLWMKTPDILKRAVIIHRSRAWTDAASQGYELLLLEGKLHAALIHFWPGNALAIQDRELLKPGEWHHVVMAYDGSSRADGLKLWVDGKPARTVVIRDNLWKRINGGGTNALIVGERFRDVGFKGGLVDDVTVVGRSVTAADVAELRNAGELAKLHKDAAISPRARNRLFDWWLSARDTVHRKNLAELAALRKKLNTLLDRTSSIMVMKEMEKPKPTFVLKRGRYDARGKTVKAGVPGILPQMAADLPRNRLGLARWLTDPGHPLAARVAVNRLWQIAFGRGLVSTTENFGTQGQRPSHPHLLDFLAREFIDSGWDVKAMLRRIMNSSTWQQSSRPAPDLMNRDPENNLLARGPRYRLPAEMVRDHALDAAGLLVGRIGGPSVRPYQPPGLWQEKSGKTYAHSKGEGLYRRSLYTFWKRTSPPPYMLIFDAAHRDVCVVRRHQTNTSTQALVLMNDPQFFEAARMLAHRVMRERKQGAEAGIAHAFSLLTGRLPWEEELKALMDLHLDALATARSTPADSGKMLAVGDSTVDKDVDPAEWVAMTLVCSTIMNLDSTIQLR